MPAHVHPPFPSFTWVMTAQANPPSAAYAYGYVQNAHTDMKMQLKMRLPTHRGRYRPYYPRSTTKSPRAHDEKHMVKLISIFTCAMFIRLGQLTILSLSPVRIGNGGLSFSRTANAAVHALARELQHIAGARGAACDGSAGIGTDAPTSGRYFECDIQVPWRLWRRRREKDQNNHRRASSNSDDPFSCKSQAHWRTYVERAATGVWPLQGHCKKKSGEATYDRVIHDHRSSTIAPKTRFSTASH